MQKLASLINMISDKRDGLALYNVLKGVYDRLSCQMFTSPGLVITATSGKKVPKTGSAISYGMRKGVPLAIAAGLDMPALAGTVANATFNVFCFFATAQGAITSIAAGELTSAMGIAGASLAAVKFPAIPEGCTMIGYIIINPTGTGDFVGGTTALDDVTVAPNAVYINTLGGFDPTAII